MLAMHSILQYTLTMTHMQVYTDNHFLTHTLAFLIHNTCRHIPGMQTHLIMQCGQRHTTDYVVGTMYMHDLDYSAWVCSGTCLRWSLCTAATSLKLSASLAPNSTKSLQSTSVYKAATSSQLQGPDGHWNN